MNPTLDVQRVTRMVSAVGWRPAATIISSIPSLKPTTTLLAGIFKNSKTMENFNVVASGTNTFLRRRNLDRLAAHEAKIEAKSKEIGKITKAENNRLITAAMNRAGATCCGRPGSANEQIQIASGRIRARCHPP